MKPYFSITVSVMPWSSDISGDTDQLRLTMAKYTESDSEDEDDSGQLETIENMSMRIGDALEWLSDRFRLKSEYFYECVASQVFKKNRLPLEKWLEAEMEMGDADFGDMIRRIAKKCEEMKI